ncbi:hypothetical protein [Nostoc sp. DedQUE03]|uniref:hypothetical protein n=1 Tax=Nostoc sp. DedQUE03 TaxID=3075389 RepID=UPI0039197C64
MALVTIRLILIIQKAITYSMVAMTMILLQPLAPSTTTEDSSPPLGRIPSTVVLVTIH